MGLQDASGSIDKTGMVAAPIWGGTWVEHPPRPPRTNPPKYPVLKVLGGARGRELVAQ